MKFFVILSVVLVFTSCSDVKSICGDGVCDETESCECTDCPPCHTSCGNGICETTDDMNICPEDCADIHCGNGNCDNEWGEDFFTCPSDCPDPNPDIIPRTCGNGICEWSWESYSNCYEDCHCGDARCDQSIGENELNCAVDCSECGNGVCGPTELFYTCPSDCHRPIECGDMICELDESTIMVDVETGEEAGTMCPHDCWCGNGTCDLSENYESCPEDCAQTCGDGVCNPTDGEIAWYYCPIDCNNCNDPDYPVECPDQIGCWPHSVNCLSDVFYCGGQAYRCGWLDRRANCCNGVFNACPDNQPYFCEAEDRCYEQLVDFRENCSSANDCTLLNLPCAS